MKLILIFGIWMNITSVTALEDINHVPFRKADFYCFVSFAGNEIIIIENKTCDEVAAEINKHLENK